MTKFLTKSRLCGLLCMLLGGAACGAAARFTPKGLLASDPGPGLFPIIGGAGLALCGLIIFLQNSDKSPPFASDFDRTGLIRIGECAVLLAVYFAVIGSLGFLVSTAVLLFLLCGLFALGEQVAWRKRLIFTALTTGAVWYLFVEVLSVMLPRFDLF